MFLKGLVARLWWLGYTQHMTTHIINALLSWLISHGSPDVFNHNGSADVSEMPSDSMSSSSDNFGATCKPKCSKDQACLCFCQGGNGASCDPDNKPLYCGDCKCSCF